MALMAVLAASQVRGKSLFGPNGTVNLLIGGPIRLSARSKVQSEN